MFKHIVFSLLLLLSLGATKTFAQASWPGEGSNASLKWIDYIDTSGTAVTDPVGDFTGTPETPMDLCGSASDSACFKVATDGTTMFFRIQHADSKPLNSDNQQFVIKIMSGSQSFWLWVHMGGWQIFVDNTIVPPYEVSGSVRDIKAATSYYFDIQIPVSVLNAACSFFGGYDFKFNVATCLDLKYKNPNVDMFGTGSLLGDNSKLASTSFDNIKNGFITRFAIIGDAGTEYALLNYFDGIDKSVYADTGGVYIIYAPNTWKGTITPTKPGYDFTPESRSYNIIKGNQFDQDFTASVAVYKISGNTGTPGVTLSYSNGGEQTVKSGLNGNYTITVPKGWSGTITPSKAGCSFIPSYRDYSNVTASIPGENYSLSVLTYFITGNAGIGGAVLSYTDTTAKTITADSLGNYSIPVSYNWSGKITPVKEGYTFTPAVKSYISVTEDINAQNYSVELNKYTITGSAGIAGASILYKEGTIKSVTADENGKYTVIVPYNWDGSLTPSKAGYMFIPGKLEYEKVTENKTEQNFTAKGIGYVISGNAGTGGVTISYTDTTARSAVSDSAGNYSAVVSYNWSGVITPVKAGYTFTPEKRVYENIMEDKTGENYTAATIGITISGNTGTGGVTLSYMDSTAKSAQSDSLGNYIFAVSYNWSGKVIPSKAGYAFKPVNKEYNEIKESQPEQNYTAMPVEITISGNVGTGDAVLSYTDGTTKTVKADGAGSYSFTVSYNWSGTITPAKAGYRFTPQSLNLTNVTADKLSQDFTAAQLTSVEEWQAGAPKAYMLAQNYPNPFNPSTTIYYSLIKECYVTVEVYDILGEKITNLVSETETAGNKSVKWEAGGMASGLYLYRITALPTDGSQLYTSVRKMFLMK
jgi:hypothetical protein